MNHELLKIAFTQYGVKEIAGQGDNPEILKYFSEIGFDVSQFKDETAWCCAGMNWVCMKGGYERSQRLNARSYLEVGYQVTTPEPGDVVVFWRESRESWKGHVAFFINQNKDYIYVLGGNQDNSWCIKAYRKEQLLQYRRLSKINEA